jgi:hypothetical protein
VPVRVDVEDVVALESVDGISLDQAGAERALVFPWEKQPSGVSFDELLVARPRHIDAKV